ncbi:MAG: L-lactate dehydrogenase [Sedimentisphaerales bacterium]|nr:L-lactate dehydrogenase [Sedimentisphaerales bacterium]
MDTQSRKVVVIGTGSVGCSYVYALMQTGLANEIILLDRDEERLEGEVMDLSHGLPFTPPVQIRAGCYTDCRDANLVVITAGTGQKNGESRLDLVQRNAAIVRSICDQVGDQTTECIIVIVTNPVDILTYLANRHLQWPRGRIIGSGTVLDTARFRTMLSRHCQVDARNIHAYILGEHGDSEIAAWSMAHIAGMNINKYCPKCRKCDYEKTHNQLVEDVRDSAYHIIDYKGATYYGIGLSLVRITEAILRNENSVLTVSTMLEGEYGLDDICLSVPCVIGRNGITSIIESNLPQKEKNGLQASADVLRKILDQIKT